MEAHPSEGPVKEEGDALLDDEQASPGAEPAPPGAEPAPPPAAEPGAEADPPPGAEPAPPGAEPAAPEGEPEAAPAAEPDAEADPPPEPSDSERADQYLALAQRTQADFENFRKRAARDTRAAEARGVSKAARELLPALDHLGLALDNLDGPALEGIRLVQRELLGVLTRLGIEAYSPKGEAFDPQVHEAVSQVAVEGVAAGTVFEVMQHGYKHGDAVLRPARVVVAG